MYVVEREMCYIKIIDVGSYSFIPLISILKYSLILMNVFSFKCVMFYLNLKGFQILSKKTAVCRLIPLIRENNTFITVVAIGMDCIWTELCVCSSKGAQCNPVLNSLIINKVR